MEKKNEFNQTGGGYCNNDDSSSQMSTGDNFLMNGGCFFDFSNDGGGQQNSILDGGVHFPAAAGAATTVAVEKVQPSYGVGDFGGDFAAYDNTHFSGQLCVPQDDLAELELSTILAEEDSYSFTNEELEKLQLIKGMSSSCSTSRGPARPEKRRHWSQLSSPDWASSSLMQRPATTSGAVVRDRAEPKPRRKVVRENSEGRKCTHCSVDSTPQWRSGPAGPKTLCNACGVRYKSGRLVPEYRPMASPTYVPTKHSNSHRKVLELRRQKESSLLVRAHQQQLQDNDDQSRHHHHYNHYHHHHHDQRHYYNGDHSNNYFDPCFLI